MRATVIAAFAMCMTIPALASAQRLEVQAAGGSIVNGGGHVLSAAFGYAPVSWLELLVNVERDHLPFEVKQFPEGGSGATRGGTLTFVSGEVRLGPTLGRVSPFALAGIGGGTSRPNVNAMFPTPVTNDLQMVYVGGGVRVPLGKGLSLIGDARAMLAAEGDEGILGMVPVRAGIAWRF
jgi:hypothetical protein